jgi:hypothetical protein
VEIDIYCQKNGRKRHYYRVYLQYVRCIMAHSCCRQRRFHLNVKTKLIGTEGTRLLREKRVEGRPRRRMRRGRTARGKRVPEVEIDIYFLQAIKNCRQRHYYRVYLQYVRCIMAHSFCRQRRFHLNVKTKLIGTEGTRLLREKRVEGKPRRRMRRGWTARGKRVHGVEINKWMVEISLDWMVLKLVVLLL